jgi:hypothetical protein
VFHAEDPCVFLTGQGVGLRNGWGKGASGFPSSALSHYCARIMQRNRAVFGGMQCWFEDVT